MFVGKINAISRLVIKVPGDCIYSSQIFTEHNSQHTDLNAQSIGVRAPSRNINESIQNYNGTENGIDINNTFGTSLSPSIDNTFDNDTFCNGLSWKGFENNTANNAFGTSVFSFDNNTFGIDNTSANNNNNNFSWDSSSNNKNHCNSANINMHNSNLSRNNNNINNRYTENNSFPKTAICWWI